MCSEWSIFAACSAPLPGAWPERNGTADDVGLLLALLRPHCFGVCPLRAKSRRSQIECYFLLEQLGRSTRMSWGACSERASGLLAMFPDGLDTNTDGYAPTNAASHQSLWREHALLDLRERCAWRTVANPRSQTDYVFLTPGAFAFLVR